MGIQCEVEKGPAYESALSDTSKEGKQLPASWSTLGYIYGRGSWKGKVIEHRFHAY